MKKSAENGKGVKKKHTWRMFIASSKEGIEYAKAIQLVINRKFKRKVCEVWNEGAFKNGKAYLETLEHLASDFDCGLAVFTADRPAGNQWAPSYNVVLEYGLFLGAFGRNRTFVLREDAKGKVLEIPTDLAGITLGEFSTSEEMGESERSEAVKRASMEVVKLLRDQPPPNAEPLERIKNNWRDHETLSREQFKLFSFYGLRDRQDDASPGWNERNVYYLWADPLGSSIQARVMPNAKGLEVEFQNRRARFPGNVAIRVSKLCVPVARSGSFRNLRFRAYIPPGSPPNVWLGIRVVDALTTHWMYCSEEGKDNRLTVSPGVRGQLFTIPLHDSNSWKPFTADGNYCYHSAIPDFSQILAVVIEVGTETSWRPGDDPGKVQLKDFRLE